MQNWTEDWTDKHIFVIYRQEKAYRLKNKQCKQANFPLYDYVASVESSKRLSNESLDGRQTVISKSSTDSQYKVPNISFTKLSGCHHFIK